MSATPSPKHFSMPELCNAQAIALIVLIAELIAVLLVLAGGSMTWQRFGLTSLFVQWVAIGSAGIACTLRPILSRLRMGVGVSIVLVVILGVTLAVGMAAQFIATSIGIMIHDPIGDVLRQLLISGIISGVVLRYFQVQQRLRQQEQVGLESKIQALQSRIRPHFLFNSMNIIASLIESDPKTAEIVVEDLAELFRASLNEVGNMVPLSSELDLCERYIRIEALRLGDRLNMEWDVEDVRPGVSIPMLSLQPLLENAIYHGVQPLRDGGTISVRLIWEEERMTIEVQNPMPEQNPASSNQGNRMALNNIRSRLDVLYGGEAGLEASEVDGTFLSRLYFPLQTEEEAG